MSEPEHVRVYLRVRRVFGDPAVRHRDARRRKEAARRTETVPYGPGRDPVDLTAALGAITAARGWDAPIARSELLTAWPDLVGPDVAAHSSPADLDDGLLLVRCDSTAWAVQLRGMTDEIVRRCAERFPAAHVETVRFIGPDAPSWKHGPRSIPGRGPRDTYG